jgi:hypothetical protein
MTPPPTASPMHDQAEKVRFHWLLEVFLFLFLNNGISSKSGLSLDQTIFTPSAGAGMRTEHSGMSGSERSFWEKR